MSGEINVTNPDKPKKVLMVIANPSTSTTLGIPVKEVNYDDYDALVVVGGQSPMFTFRDHEELKNAVKTFYEADKVTSALCHGAAALMDVTLSDDSYLIDGKTMTGFANVEEEFADNYVGKKVMPWHIEDSAKERRANYIQGGRFKGFRRPRWTSDHGPAAVLRRGGGEPRGGSARDMISKPWIIGPR